MNLFKYDNIIEQITKRNRISRFIVLLIGAFIAALAYNAFIVPNNIVYGGVGGIAIIVNKLFGINTTLFMDIVTFLLAFISIFIIGFKTTTYTIIGFFFYTVMINVTAFLTPYLPFQFESHLLGILFYSFLSGIGFGLIYKCGFNTGGSDSIIAIIQKYFPFPTAYLSNIVNGLIILLGAMTFGIVNSIYAIVYLKLLNFFSDRTIVGTSTNKLVFIKTKNLKEVENILTKDLEIGYTLIESTNGIGLLKKEIIMCVVPTDRFYALKQDILLIDKNARLISNDCYTVVGGHTNLLINVNN